MEMNDDEIVDEIAGKPGDPVVMAEIAKTHRFAGVRCAAIMRLHDPAVLEEIAKADRNPMVRLMADSRLNDHDLADARSKLTWARFYEQTRRLNDALDKAHLKTEVSNEFND